MVQTKEVHETENPSLHHDLCAQRDLRVTRGERVIDRGVASRDSQVCPDSRDPPVFTQIKDCPRLDYEQVAQRR